MRKKNRINNMTNKVDLIKNLKPKVAKIIDEYNVVLNKGIDDGIKKGMEFVIYQQTEEIIDPETGKLLECLYVHKGEGKIIQVQNKISTLKSTEIDAPSSFAEALRFSFPKLKPFNEVNVGDNAKLINYEEPSKCTNCGSEIEEDADLCSNCQDKNNETET
jgi:hypothetical protein